MMGIRPNSMGEVQRLVDQLFESELSAAEYSQLELLLQDQRSLQSFVERVDFHCELIEQADLKSAEESALEGLHRFSLTAAAKERRMQRLINFTMAMSILLVMVVGGWMYRSMFLVPVPVGAIASLSTDLRVHGATLDLGQVVHAGQTISIGQGIVGLDLGEVTINLVGPASIRLRASGEISLVKGSVLAKVNPAAIGFTVRTPDTQVVDLGTEFLVQYESSRGTYVSVRRGAAQAKLVDWRGQPTRILELTASRAGQFHRDSGEAAEVAYSPVPYQRVDQSRGGIKRLTGALRTIEEFPASLENLQCTTPNHMLVMPENRVQLSAPLTVNSISGPVTIPAGTTLCSYLVHYDPTEAVLFAPRGAVSFFGEIAAIVGDSAGLAATDAVFGKSEAKYEAQAFRQLELEEDEIRISDDRTTVSFFFGVSPPEFLDEVRILVMEGPQ